MYLFAVSVTKICVILLFSNLSKASTAIASSRIVFGFLPIISLAVKSSILVVLLNILRMSPSVIIPTIAFCAFSTAVTPNLFSEISTITFAILSFSKTFGT